MFDIDSIDTQEQSVTAPSARTQQLFGATPERGEFDPATSGTRRRHRRGERSLPHPRRGRRTRRLPARRRAREPALGLRQHLRRPGPQTRPRRRQALARAARPPERPGRHRESSPASSSSSPTARRTSATAATPSRPCATPPPTPTAPRPATPGARATARNVSQTGKLTSAAIDARDFMRARKDRETRAHLPREPWSPSPAARTVATPAPSSRASTRPGRSTTTSSSCTAAAPASSASPRSGPSATASTRSCASRTGTCL